jgi:hypothetical protein
MATEQEIMKRFRIVWPAGAAVPPEIPTAEEAQEDELRRRFRLAPRLRKARPIAAEVTPDGK